MSSGFDDGQLIKRALGGDQDALTALFWQYYPRIHGVVRCNIPADCASLIDADDVVQITLEDAFRTFSKFEDRGEDSLFKWLAAIARMRLLDVIKGLRADKRPDPADRVQRPALPAQTRAGTLLDALAKDDHTPSRSAARHERERAVIAALAGLKEHYRQALELRYLECMPVAEIAQRMGRTERSVHMLCNRALKKLRDRMASASHYLTR